MYQTRESLLKDVPALADAPSSTHLYLTVDELETVERAVQGAPVVIPRRKTFYGAVELGVREPGGNVVTFSAHQAG